MLASRVAPLLATGFLLLAACATTAPSKMDPRTKDPCVSCTPESFCAGWSLPEDRKCRTADDCIVTVVRFSDVSCSFGLYGGAAHAITSRAAEAKVRSRLAAVAPCELAEKVRGGSVCASPPLECLEGLCGYEDGPPQIAY